MGKLFTTDTSDVINVAMTVQPICFDDRYAAEVQSADLKVWNKSTKLFCTVLASIGFVDTENPRNVATVLLEEMNVELQSLSKQLSWRGGDVSVTIDSIITDNEQSEAMLKHVIGCASEIEINIEGI